MRTKDVLIRIPLLGTMLIYVYRAKIVFKHSIVFFVKLAIWLYKSKETTNFTYDLEKLNISYLASLIADITDTGITDCVNYINEIKEDAKLRDHIEELTRQSDRHLLQIQRHGLEGELVGMYL